MASTRSSSKPQTSNKYVSSVLNQFNIYGSSTPEAFTEKARHINESVCEKKAVVFTDVLRATTTLNAVGAAGCKGIHLAVKPTTGQYDCTPPILQDQQWICGGEENGRPIQGGQINNSPLSIQPSQLEGKYLKFFSTNGARALAAITTIPADAVFLMSMANIEVTMETLISQGFDRVWFIGGGFYGSASLEDNVCCGEAIGYLINRGLFSQEQLDDEATIMCHAAAPYCNNDELLIRKLYDSQVAKLLCDMGRGEDVAAAIRGDGMSAELWSRMRRTVIQLQWFGDTPLLIPNVI